MIQSYQIVIIKLQYKSNWFKMLTERPVVQTCDVILKNFPCFYPNFIVLWLIVIVFSFNIYFISKTFLRFNFLELYFGLFIGKSYFFLHRFNFCLDFYNFCSLLDIKERLNLVKFLLFFFDFIFNSVHTFHNDIQMSFNIKRFSNYTI